MSAVYPTSLKRKLPYITVSAKGLSNGQSSIPNDGADFGPDTMLGATAPNQYGPPYTQTAGIQEALNYAASLSPFAPTLKLSAGDFYIYDTIILPYISQGYNGGLTIEGAGPRATVINGSGIQAMKWAQPSQLNQGWTFRGLHISIGNPPANTTVIDLSQTEASTGLLIDNCIFDTGNNTGSYIAATTLDISGNEDSAIMNTIIDESGENPALTWYIPYGTGSMINVMDFGGTFIEAQNMDFVNCVFGAHGLINISAAYSQSTYKFSGCYWNGTSTSPSQIALAPSAVGSSSNELFMDFENCMILPAGANLSLGNPFFVNNSSTVITLIARFKDTIMQSNTAVNLFGSNIKGYAVVEGLPLTNVNINNFAISTPAVPSSGTAVANTNPFDVMIYLNGGTVTAVNKISGGNTYSVFSNSSGASLANLPVHLKPNEGISITYTSAPTWVWVPA